jgi:hypothetical protein
MHSAPSNHPKLDIYVKKYPPAWGHSQSKAISQKWHSRKFVNGGDAFSMFKLPKISCLFDNNVSPGINDVPSQKQYLRNGTVEYFFMVAMH